MMLSKEEILKNSTTEFNYQGVYFLIKKDEIVYVGSSVSIPTRIASHYRLLDFDSYSFILISTKDVKELQTLEADYILKFNPKHNRRLPSNDKYIPLNRNLPYELVCIQHRYKEAVLTKNGIRVIKFKGGKNRIPFIYAEDQDMVTKILLANKTLLEQHKSMYL